METCLYFVKKSPVRIWGLTPSERAKKVLDGAVRCIDDLSEVGKGQRVLILRGDYLFEDRLLKELVKREDVFLYVKRLGKKTFVAANVDGAAAKEAVKILEGRHDEAFLEGYSVHSPETIAAGFDANLKKFETPFVLPVSKRKARELEDRLFDWSYKGVTDLVTKWWWPKPAKEVVRTCVKLGIKPNHVTLLGFILVIIAGYLFYQGYLGLGLVAAWLMTFLDTVDGKLARVTVTSSKFGHYFDHLIDLIHPPFWYLLWGLGVENTGRYLLDYPSVPLYWAIFIGYIVGRLVEGAFQMLSGGFVIFCWRPVDSVFRLVTARRNPCLIILSISYIVGRPDYGLLGVAVWTVLSSAFLVLRLLMALFQRARGKRLTSWLDEVDRAQPKDGLLYRWFVKRA
ncbi:MAG: CDP-alcohol phosphatidyltransferase family protein [Thermodesulfobacteria bacterium]|nr:CDP-alcohol phosphatidyltransferase family protein [Thermodesulfobacteriota bacterium]